MSVYLKKHLLKALKKVGLPCSYSTLLKYERKGIISKPLHNISYDTSEWRTYTQEEIDQIIGQVKAHRKK